MGEIGVLEAEAVQIDIPEVSIIYPTVQSSIGYVVNEFYRNVRPQLIAGKMSSFLLAEFRDSVERISRKCRGLPPEVVSANRLILSHLGKVMGPAPRRFKHPEEDSYKYLRKIAPELAHSIDRQVMFWHCALRREESYSSSLDEEISAMLNDALDRKLVFN